MYMVPSWVKIWACSLDVHLNITPDTDGLGQDKLSRTSGSTTLGVEFDRILNFDELSWAYFQPDF